MAGAGAVWVVYGKADDDTQDLAALTAAAGYRIDGLAAGDRFGRQVARVGDVDGNGAADFAAGGDFSARPLAPATPRSQAGEATIALMGDPLTKTALTSSATGDLEAGDTADLTATVTAPAGGAGAVQSGTVAFSRDGTPIAGCEAVAVDPADGTAQCQGVQFDTFGTYDVTAAYAGGDDYLDSTSDAVEHTVVEDSETTLGAPASLLAGETGTFEVAVEGASSGEPATAGTVALASASGPIPGCGAIALDASGEGSCSASFDAAGSVAVTASYVGTPTLRASDSAVATVNVNRPADPPDPGDPATAPRIAISTTVVRVDGDGDGALAEVSCGTGGGSCRLEAETTRLRIGKKRFEVAPDAPASVDAGATVAITLSLRGRVAKALRERGKGFVRLRLGAFSDAGGAIDAGQLTLKPERG